MRDVVGLFFLILFLTHASVALIGLELVGEYEDVQLGALSREFVYFVDSVQEVSVIATEPNRTPFTAVVVGELLAALPDGGV